MGKRGTRAVPKLTLDTNCIIAVENREPEATAIWELIAAHKAGIADVAVVAISASERQRGPLVNNFAQFRQRLADIGLGQLVVLPAMFYFDISFYDHALLPDDVAIQLETDIHNVLFPSVEFLWTDYCAARNQDVVVPDNRSEWRNAKCDVQALWSHIHHGRDVFVTSDGCFHSATRRDALIALGARGIMHPTSALKIVAVDAKQDTA